MGEQGDVVNNDASFRMSPLALRLAGRGDGYVVHYGIWSNGKRRIELYNVKYVHCERGMSEPRESLC